MAKNRCRMANESSYQQYTPSRTHEIPLRNTPRSHVADSSASGYHPAVSALVMSPTSQPSPGAPLHRSMENLSTQPSTNRRPNSERMHHKIPHRFITGLNSRATKCAVCLGSIHFVKQAAKCAGKSPGQAPMSPVCHYC